MKFAYDVFVSYRWVEPDQTWVRDELVPALKSAGLEVCLDVEDFVPGRDLIIEMTRAGTQSRRAICVLSPDYFEGNRMASFESLMARRLDPGAVDSHLIPVVLRSCTLPEHLRGLIPVDWTTPTNHRREWRRLLKVLGATQIEAKQPGRLSRDHKNNETPRVAPSDPSSEQHAKGLLLGGTDGNDQLIRYIAPGGALPANAENYVRRSFDRDIQQLLRTSSHALAVFGGPRTGKSSYLVRLRDAAICAGWPCHYVDMTNLWEAKINEIKAERPDGKLSFVDVANTLCLALDDPKPLVRPGQDHTFIVHQLQKRLAEIFARFNDSLVIIDGYNDAVYCTIDPEDPARIAHHLFTYTNRRDRCKVILADDGLAADFPFVSSTMARGDVVNTSQFGLHQIDELARRIFSYEVSSTTEIWMSLLDAFGDVPFLHHCAIHRLRGKIIEADMPITEAGVRNLLIPVILNILEEISYPVIKTSSDKISREIGRFSERTEYLLLTIARRNEKRDPKQTTRAFLEALTDTEKSTAAVMTDYRVIRSLKFAGILYGHDDNISGYGRCIAARTKNTVPASD